MACLEVLTSVVFGVLLVLLALVAEIEGSLCFSVCSDFSIQYIILYLDKRGKKVYNKEVYYER